MSKRKHKKRKPVKKRKIVKQNNRQSAMSRFHDDTVGTVGNNMTIVESELKMSEVIGDFISPYVDDIDMIDEYKVLVTFAAMAWNSALLPPEAQEEAIEHIRKSIPAGDESDAIALFNDLLERKQRHFDHIKRMIVNHEATELADGEWYLAIASSLSEDEVAEYEAQQQK
jgi:hypothetical protein